MDGSGHQHHGGPGGLRPRQVVGGSAVLLLLLGLVPATATAQEATSKPAVVAEGEWSLRDTLDAGWATTTFVYGRADGFDGDHMLCDWDGDGTRTPGLRRRSAGGGNPVWHLRDTNGPGPADHTFVYGREGDRPVCGDWNGDGTQTPGVVRHRADGRFVWHLRDEVAGGAADTVFVYGRHTEELPPAFPVVGDWDGDGSQTPGLVRGRDDGRLAWFLRDELAGGNADVHFTFSTGAVWGDHLDATIPLVGDWDGDGRDTAGIARTSNGSPYRWSLRNEHADGPADHEFVYGRSGLEIPLVWR